MGTPMLNSCLLINQSFIYLGNTSPNVSKKDLKSCKIFLFTWYSDYSLSPSYFFLVSPLLCTRFSFCLPHIQMSFFSWLPFPRNPFFLLFHLPEPAVPVPKIFPWLKKHSWLKKLLKTENFTGAENHHINTFLYRWCFGQCKMLGVDSNPLSFPWKGQNNNNGAWIHH